MAGFDVHRRQITVDALDTATGEVSRGQIESTPAAVEEWVAGFPGRVMHVAVEACTGWLFVSRALERCGAIAHLAEPVETSALRGRKRRAKTDRADAKWLRELLFQVNRLPIQSAPAAATSPSIESSSGMPAAAAEPNAISRTASVSGHEVISDRSIAALFSSLNWDHIAAEPVRAS